MGMRLPVMQFCRVEFGSVIVVVRAREKKNVRIRDFMSSVATWPYIPSFNVSVNQLSTISLFH